MSNLRALRAGIMPSHSWETRVHSAFMVVHRALAMSMSKPENLPSVPIWENGG